MRLPGFTPHSLCKVLTKGLREPGIYIQILAILFSNQNLVFKTLNIFDIIKTQKREELNSSQYVK